MPKITIKNQKDYQKSKIEYNKNAKYQIEINKKKDYIEQKIAKIKIKTAKNQIEIDKKKEYIEQEIAKIKVKRMPRKTKLRNL